MTTLTRLQRVVVAFAAVLAIGPASAADPERTPGEWLAHFSAGWDEAAWIEQHRSYPDGYMRPLDDAGWKSRMQALQGLVRAGDAAVPVLLEALRAEDVAQRILASQALGYLAPRAPAERLIEALRGEPHAAVRLYLVDAIGMHGEGAGHVDWDAFLEREKDRDVRRHVSYVREREGRAVEPWIVEQLTSWDPSDISTAVVDQPAPDFEVTSAQGERVKLSDYRGRSAVVLVFIYGDT